MLLLALKLLLVGLALALGSLQTLTNWSQERVQGSEEILFRHTGLPVKQEEQLTFHQVHLGQGESEPLISLHHGIASPVLILWAGVIQVLSSENE
jgi:hypothetical protein